MTAVVGSSCTAGPPKNRAVPASLSNLVSTRPSQEWCGTGTGHRPDRIGPSDHAVTPRIFTHVRRTQAGPPPDPCVRHPRITPPNPEDLEMNPTTMNATTPEPTTHATPFVTHCRDGYDKTHPAVRAV